MISCTLTLKFPVHCLTDLAISLAMKADGKLFIVSPSGLGSVMKGPLHFLYPQGTVGQLHGAVPLCRHWEQVKVRRSSIQFVPAEPAAG